MSNQDNLDIGEVVPIEIADTVTIDENDFPTNPYLRIQYNGCPVEYQGCPIAYRSE